MNGKNVFASRLIDWFLSAMRPLPWRDRYDPYRVWISEIMLQQTQMERGVRYFNNWMRLFPDIRSVAAADEEAILAAWEGLGYYSRARNLHAAAKRVMDRHGGEFPRSHEDIRALPGVGDYTAGAIASIAFNLPVPAVDANVLRIFARVLDIDAPVTEQPVKLAVAEAAQSLMPEQSPRLFNQALMELGALVCGKTPKCGECPLTDLCAAHGNGTASARPVKAAKAAHALHEVVAGVIMLNGRAFIRKRPPRGLWAGLWEFPGGAAERGETPEQAVIRHIRAETGASARVREKIGVVRHGYTTNRVTMHGYVCEMNAGSPSPSSGPSGGESRWASPGEAARLAFAAGHRKLLERLGWKREEPIPR